MYWFDKIAFIPKYASVVCLQVSAQEICELFNQPSPALGSSHTLCVVDSAPLSQGWGVRQVGGDNAYPASLSEHTEFNMQKYQCINMFRELKETF